MGRGVLIARHILIVGSGTYTLITSSLSAYRCTPHLTIGDWRVVTIWRASPCLTCGISCEKMNLFAHPFNLILTKGWARTSGSFIYWHTQAPDGQMLSSLSLLTYNLFFDVFIAALLRVAWSLSKIYGFTFNAEIRTGNLQVVPYIHTW